MESERGGSMFGRENEVNEVGGEGLRHGEGRPFRAWVGCCVMQT